MTTSIPTPGPKAPLVLYHGGCRDGWASAVVAHMCLLADGLPLPGVAPGVPDLVAAYHGQPAPAAEAIRGRDVYILDFSYDLPTMVRMWSEARSLTVFDHHATAAAALRALAEQETGGTRPPRVVYAEHRCGAGITWDELTKGAPRPWWVSYVEDRDLWRKALPDTDFVNAHLGSIPFTLGAWADLGKDQHVPLDVLRTGRAICAKVDQYVAEVRKNAIKIDGMGMCPGDIQAIREIPLVNAPQADISELLQSFVKAGSRVAMGWFQRADGLYVYSIRSDGSIDVSQVATYFGGGGHKSAAGFQSDHMIEAHVTANAKLARARMPSWGKNAK